MKPRGVGMSTKSSVQCASNGPCLDDSDITLLTAFTEVQTDDWTLKEKKNRTAKTNIPHTKNTKNTVSSYASVVTGNIPCSLPSSAVPPKQHSVKKAQRKTVPAPDPPLNKTTVIVNTKVPNAAKSTGSPKRKWVHIFDGVDLSSPAEGLCNYVKQKLTIDDVLCFSLQSDRSTRATFKIRVPRNHFNTFLDPQFWPSGAKLKSSN